jgi:hypothetical protein
MKIWTNFNTHFFREIKNINKEKYWEDFFIARHHRFILFKKTFSKLVIWMLVLLPISFIIYSNTPRMTYLRGVGLWVLFVLFLVDYWIFKLSFLVINTDAITVYRQSSLFERKVFVISANTITSLQISNPNYIGTFLRFGSVSIFSNSSELPFIVRFFPNIQKNQLIIRKYIHS